MSWLSLPPLLSFRPLLSSCSYMPPSVTTVLMWLWRAREGWQFTHAVLNAGACLETPLRSGVYV